MDMGMILALTLGRETGAEAKLDTALCSVCGSVWIENDGSALKYLLAWSIDRELTTFRA